MNDTVKQRTNVLGVGVSAINMKAAVSALLDARSHGEKGYVCVTGVHGVIESQRDPELKRIHNRSFLTVPDGMPTVWMGREQGFVHMGRVYGPDLMLRLCEATAGRGSVKNKNHSVKEQDLGVKQEENASTDLKPNHQKPKTADASHPLTHFLYGSTPEVLAKLQTNLEHKFPGIRIVGTFSPPFRALNDAEEKELQQIVAACRPDFFWVGLSTPKQERFMASHSPANDGFKNYDLSVKNKNHSVKEHDLDVKQEENASTDLKPNHLIPKTEPAEGSLKPNHLKLKTAALERYPLDCGIMLGVGAAFDIHAGLLKDAPEWIKNSGLQWFYRLCQEPKRLWRRYLDIVPKFLGLTFLQLLGIRKYTVEEENTSSF